MKRPHLGRMCSINGTGHFSNASYNKGRFIKIASGIQARVTHRQHGMVSEEEYVSDDLPGEIPVEVLFVNEDTHELGNSKGWVCLSIPNFNIFSISV